MSEHPAECLRPRSILHHALLFALAVALLVTLAGEAVAQEPGLDDPHIDLALLCLADTRLERFVADPAEVQPFEQTTLSWRVAVPPGCRVTLSLAGRTVERSGSLDVTPVHADSSFDLVAGMLGARGVLGSARVAVDVDDCSSGPEIPQAALEDRLAAALELFVADRDDIELVALPDELPRIDESGLFIDGLVLDVDPGALEPTIRVRLEIGVRFTVRDGRVLVRYVLFRPTAETGLPDALVSLQGLFDQAETVRRELEERVNAFLAGFLDDDQQLFDLLTVQDALLPVVCPIEPVPGRLTVRLRVLPAGDPGRFDLRVDGRTRKGGAGDGESTGVLEVSSGLHRVSQTAASGTRLGDYRSFVGGDCEPDGRVVLRPGDVAICFVTNVRQEAPDRCEADCRDERDLCRADPQLSPAICTALFRNCMNSCN